MLRPVALQGAFFGAIGLGVYALRRLSARPLDERVASRPILAARHPAMAASLSQLARLADADAFDAVLVTACEIAEHDRSGDPKSQWHIARLSTQLVRQVEEICNKADRDTSDAVFRDSIACREEVVPALQTQLETILHNHLLSRAPRLC